MYKKILVPPWGASLPPKMLKNPPMIVIFLKSCQILLKICTLSNLMVLKSFLMLFWPQKRFLTSLRMVLPLKPPFGWKMAFWAYIFETAHQTLMIFSQMLDIIAINDLALVLCTKKIYFPPGGIFAKKMLKIPPMIVTF